MREIGTRPSKLCVTLLVGTESVKDFYACIYWKKWRFGRVTLMPDSQPTEYSAAQLVKSIKFKLSHAIYIFDWKASISVQSTSQLHILQGTHNSIQSIHIIDAEIEWPIGLQRYDLQKEEKSLCKSLYSALPCEAGYSKQKVNQILLEQIARLFILMENFNFVHRHINITVNQVWCALHWSTLWYDVYYDMFRDI